MYLYFLLTKFVLVYSQWYVGEEKHQSTTSIDTEDVSKPNPATSPIECILKCQRKLKKGFFVKERNECFCVEDRNEQIASQHHEPSMEGVFHKEHMVS